MQKLPKLICLRHNYTFTEGWEVVWHPNNPSDHRGGYIVIIKHNHERGGDSVSYPYPGPASRNSSLHLIKVAIKEKDLPKSAPD